MKSLPLLRWSSVIRLSIFSKAGLLIRRPRAEPVEAQLAFRDSPGGKGSVCPYPDPSNIADADIPLIPLSVRSSAGSADYRSIGNIESARTMTPYNTLSSSNVIYGTFYSSSISFTA
jgi:hypothetical protein